MAEEGATPVLLVPPVPAAALDAFRERVKALVVAEQGGPQHHLACYEPYSALVLAILLPLPCPLACLAALWVQSCVRF